MQGQSAFRTIVFAGLICGVLDALSAVVVSGYFGAGPMRVFQGIASGLLGRSAFQGGASTALLGLILHFVVATGAAAVYYFASRQFPILIDQALACGIAFGVAVHLFMTFVVIPMSAIGRRPFVLQSFVAFLVVSMVVIGPSIAFSIRRLSKTPRAAHQSANQSPKQR
ncbi:MAG: hypothetical protein JWP63_812 [Candidatus Solibacter sp.]|nr:hypothetical protein [Candidatus Solibacter sp.]